MVEYYLLSSADVSHDAIPLEFEKRFLEEHGFPCGHYDFSFVIPRIPLLREKRSAHLWTVSAPLVRLIHNELIEWLSPEIFEGVQFGEVEIVGRGLSKRYRSYWPRKRVRLRSDESSLCWRCDVCGQLLYTIESDVIYLLRRDLPEWPVFPVNYGLAVSSEIYDRLRRRKLRKVCIDPLPIFDEPIDGLPADLNSMTKEQERRWERLDYERKKRRIRYVEDEEQEEELPPGWRYLE